MNDSDAKDLLANAKAYAQNNDFVASLNALKQCKSFAESNATFCNKIAKFASKISDNLALKKIKVALLSSSTTVFLEPLLKYFLLCNNINAQIQSGDFGSWKQDILDENSWLSDYKPDAIVVAINWRDASLNAIGNAPENTTAEIEFLWTVLTKRLKSASVFQIGFDLPKADSCGFLAYSLDNSKTQTIKKINSALLAKAKNNGVVFVDATLIQAHVGIKTWENAQIWNRAKQHPSLEALPAFASTIARAVKAKFISPKKVCVLDLDNTLWGGVISEDGLTGIHLGAPDAVGEAFEAFQQYLLELKQRGVLLAVCSKNDEEDALLPFEKHPSTKLKRTDFVSFKANWNRKSENIKQIAQELNLGLDSFVFVDDNPVEIGEVSTMLPEVECLLLPNDTSDFIDAFNEREFFDTTTISDDDVKRSQSYAENALRESAKSSANNLQDYLKSLQMQCTVELIDETNIARVEQLLGKTNQFNMTTRRHSAEFVRDFSAQPNALAKCFRLKDKFGDFGIVGIILASQKNNVLEIDSFVMSCRAMGRDFEKLMLNEIFTHATKCGISRVRGVYIPTPKNVKIKNFYEECGFETLNKNDTESQFECNTNAYQNKNIFIEVIEK